MNCKASLICRSSIIKSKAHALTLIRLKIHFTFLDYIYVEKPRSKGRNIRSERANNEVVVMEVWITFDSNVWESEIQQFAFETKLHLFKEQRLQIATL